MKKALNHRRSAHECSAAQDSHGRRNGELVAFIRIQPLPTARATQGLLGGGRCATGSAPPTGVSGAAGRLFIKR